MTQYHVVLIDLSLLRVEFEEAVKDIPHDPKLFFWLFNQALDRFFHGYGVSDLLNADFPNMQMLGHLGTIPSYVEPLRRAALSIALELNGVIEANKLRDDKGSVPYMADEVAPGLFSLSFIPY